MKFSRLVSLMYILLYSPAFSQSAGSNNSKQGNVPSKYDRNAITVLILDNNSEHVQDLKNATNGIIVPDKFDNNLIQSRYIKAASINNDIKNALITQSVPNDILSKWFARKENGEFDMAIVHERGMYNATDDEVVKASASKIGIAKLKDAGESLITGSIFYCLNFMI